MTRSPARNGARLHDLARELQPEDVRLAGRRRIAPQPLKEIGAVHTGRANADEQITRARLRIGRIADLQHFRPTEGLHEDGAHDGAR
jgi:hypothetical protein